MSLINSGLFCVCVTFLKSYSYFLRIFCCEFIISAATYIYFKLKEAFVECVFLYLVIQSSPA